MPTERGHVVFVNRFYWPDLAATAQLLTELAEGLVAQGWDVTVVAGRSSYRGGPAAAASKSGERRGVRIIRVRGTSFGRERTLGRLVDYGTYYLGALFRLLALPRPDVVVAVSDPPLLHVGCALAGRLRRVPVVAWSQDVYPDVALHLGVFRGRTILYRVLDRFARLGHSLCRAVVVVGDRMAAVLEDRGVERAGIACIPNWADTATIRPVPTQDNRLLAESGPASRFVVLYSGNAGRAHTFDGVLEAAAQLRDDDVTFVFAGGGARMPELRGEAKARGLDNVVFRDYVAKELLADSLSTASVSLVTQSPATKGFVVPSKLYPILASGRPVLYLGPRDSEVADVVREHDCGAVVPPGDTDGVVEWIRAVKADDPRREVMGQRARQAAEVDFDRPMAIRRWAGLLRRVLADDVDLSTETCATPRFAGASYAVETAPERVSLPANELEE